LKASTFFHHSGASNLTALFFHLSTHPSTCSAGGVAQILSIASSVHPVPYGCCSKYASSNHPILPCGCTKEGKKGMSMERALEKKKRDVALFPLQNQDIPAFKLGFSIIFLLTISLCRKSYIILIK
jgi:hypothetical protein